MNQFSRNIALWLVLGLMVVLLFNMFQGQQQTEEKVIYSEFIEQLQAGRIDQVTLQGDQISGTIDGGRTFTTYGPLDDAVDEIKAVDVPFEVKPQANEPWYVILLVQWFPMLLLVGVWIFFMRQMQMGGGKAMSFGKSRARLLNENEQKVTFGDVAGIEEAKEELEEIIAFLRDPKKFTRLGGRIPKGVLLVGAPGTGNARVGRVRGTGRAPARPCWHGPWRAKPACLFTRSPALTSSRCSLG